MLGMSFSDAYLALIRAVEALMDPPPSEERCDTCGARTEPGPVKLFREFVDKYVPVIDWWQMGRKEFYNIRSSLTHGGKLLRLDSSFLDFMNPQYFLQHRDLHGTRQMVSYLLVSWLDAQHNQARSSSL
jgi:hypothetical protein